MICLGIETSCDETALAIVQDGRLVASVMSSQADLHALFGGVVPELASREHSRLIGPLYDALLSEARIDSADIDTVAFARGPGLLGSLLVGAGFAKAFALGGRRLIGVDHLHAHLLAAGLEGPLAFPALGLLVSGGHTHIYRILSSREFVCLGRALDDAAGEAFDKIGKMLGLAYPAGRRINELALAGRADPDLFKPPYLNNDNLDFSFSGLKTAAAAVIRDNGMAGQAAARACGLTLEDFCASLNLTIAETLRHKFERAVQRERGIKSLILAGGVAANSFVREAVAGLARAYDLPLSLPSSALCTDNGSMIAYAGYLLAQEGGRHELDVSCIPRGTAVPADMIFRP